MNATYTASTATPDTIIDTMALLSFNHDYKRYEDKNYCYIDDTISDSTITATTKDPLNKRQDWLDEIEQSFNDDTGAFDQDFYDHQAIIQSYLEPTCIHRQQKEAIPLPTHQHRRSSKLSAIKSKVKRVFRLSTANKHPSCLPVFPTSTTAVTAVNQTWNPSIDSICSSTTTAISSRPRSIISNSSSQKSHLNRHSCMSSPFTKGHSTVSKLKNRFSRASSPCSTTPTIKGILKKQTHHPYQQRPTSAIFNKQRPNRFSIQGVPSPNKKRYTVLSTMIMSTNDDNNNNNESLNRRRVRFNKFRDIHETYHKSDYDRTSDMDAVCTRLTAVIATQIKQELNHYKLHEMQVHDSSRIHTHFFL